MRLSKQSNTLRPKASLPRLVYNRKKKEIKGYLDDCGSVLSLYEIYKDREKQLMGLARASSVNEQLFYNEEVKVPNLIWSASNNFVSICILNG